MLVLLNQLKTQAKPNWLTDGQLLNHPAATASPPEGGLCKCSPQLQLLGLGLRLEELDLYNDRVIIKSATMDTQQYKWVVEFYTDARGRSAVVEFINALPAQERAKVRNYLRLLREFGILLGMPYARPVSGHRSLWELRPGAIRLFYFAHTRRRFIILHGFRKKGRKTPRREIATAERRMAEFLEGEK